MKTYSLYLFLVRRKPIPDLRVVHDIMSLLLLIIKYLKTRGRVSLTLIEQRRILKRYSYY